LGLGLHNYRGLHLDYGVGKCQPDKSIATCAGIFAALAAVSATATAAELTNICGSHHTSALVCVITAITHGTRELPGLSGCAVPRLGIREP
jgi:hypothetical protein